MSWFMYVLLYLAVAAVTFFGLTIYWSRFRRPNGEDRRRNVTPWSDNEIFGFGLVQSAIWPLSWAFYLLWGAGVAIGITFKASRKSYMAAIKPRPAVHPARPVQDITPREDRYLLAAESEVDSMLDEEARWKELERT